MAKSWAKLFSSILSKLKKTPPVVLVFIITVVMCICFTLVMLEIVEAIRYVPEK